MSDEHIYKRDNWTCKITNEIGHGNLRAHHLDGYNWCKEKRIDINNGITWAIFGKFISSC